MEITVKTKVEVGDLIKFRLPKQQIKKDHDKYNNFTDEAPETTQTYITFGMVTGFQIDQETFEVKTLTNGSSYGYAVKDSQIISKFTETPI